MIISNYRIDPLILLTGQVSQFGILEYRIMEIYIQIYICFKMEFFKLLKISLVLGGQDPTLLAKARNIFLKDHKV